MKRFWHKTPGFKELKYKITFKKPVYLSGLTDPAAASVISELQAEVKKPLLAVVSSDSEIHDFTGLVESFLGQDVLRLPSDSPVQRMKAADYLLSGSAGIITASLQALNETMPLSGEFKNRQFAFRKGDKIYKRLVEILPSSGYIRAQVVGEPGEFARRGQVIDYWPPGYEYPVRAVFKADEVTDIRSFNPSGQRSTGSIGGARVIPFEISGSATIKDYIPEKCIVFQLSDFEEPLSVPSGASIIVRTSLRRSDIKFSTRPLSYSQSFSTAASELQALSDEGFKIYLSSESRVRLDSLVETLNSETGITPEGFISPLQEGFVSEDIRAAVLAPGDIFPSKKKVFAVEPPPPRPIEEFSDLKKGDYVVHRKFGIGQLEGIVKKSHSGMVSDFLKIKYKGNAYLYVAVENADMVQKYIGSRWKTKLDSLSSKTWRKTTGKVRRSVEALARKLIKIYSGRQRRGISFPGQEESEESFASAFPYKLTRHQEEAVAETLSDMESDKAMDRLVCGDVGFGKTEVAARAAFRAVINGYQVALLAPTTVLARQHYSTFMRRFADFPVIIEHLSRLVPESEQKVIVDKINSGRADIVIGTHRLLNKNIEFPALGLLIIDEEQRFGVEQKEDLRYRYKNVDILTTTATPIPRTLAMAMGRVKGFSLINTPPPGRTGVKTEIMPYDGEIVREALMKEVSRGGQCYFVHNRIQGLKKIRDMLSKQIPGLSFRCMHGRMAPYQIASVMDDFRRGKFNVLVSTSIIENGLDLPNVNTIIINDAHRFGLSEIYQLRGRTGRSDIRAYCYLMYAPHIELTAEVKERLQALESFSALGSGFQLALRDLQIRGAGEILGPRQHGNILKVGFDYYMEILKQEIASAKGEKYLLPAEVEISLPVSAYIPADYVEDSSLRLAFYRKLSAIAEKKKLKETTEEMKDRFGKLPPPAVNLIDIIEIKLLASQSGVRQVSADKKKLYFSFESGEKLEMDAELEDMIKAAKDALQTKIMALKTAP